MPLPVPPELVARLRAAGCVFAEEEARLLIDAVPDGAPELEGLVARRVAGEPLEHVLGWAEFAGLRIRVGPGVFVPRRRTELLVRRAVALLGGPSAPGRGVLVDLCCGSGAVAAAVLAVVDVGPEVHAVDVDPRAVACARTNLPGSAVVHLGDLVEPLPQRLRGNVDVIVASPPYVPSTALRLMPPEARLHEPAAALDGGADGLAVARRIVDAALGWLAPGGSVLLDVGAAQVAPLVARLTAHGFDPHVHADVDRGGTLVEGRLPAEVADPGLPPGG